MRLWLDDIGALTRIWPEIDANAEVQSSAGVEVRRWAEGSADQSAPGDVVIEAFACNIPDTFVAAMAGRTPPPVWFNLEYLSAEEWVESHHLLPSPHPRLPLVKYFYFPGFTPRTGGLLREAGLLTERDAFRCDIDAQNAFWQSLGVGSREADELRVSMFAYRNAAAATLFSAWAYGNRRVTCVVPDGVLAEELCLFLGTLPPVGSVATRGALSIVRIPFLRQTDYDRLLWACDVNFVRGEDSWVRAHWTAQPFVWNIYPQAEGAHWTKLDAFVRRYTAAMEGSLSNAVGALFNGWNGRGDVARGWRGIESRIADWSASGARWVETLALQPDLATGLAGSAENWL